MRLLKLLVVIILVAETYIPEPRVGRFDDQDRGPAFSAPQEEMAPNGDRVSHYPPYYHPERSAR